MGSKCSLSAKVRPSETTTEIRECREIRKRKRNKEDNLSKSITKLKLEDTGLKTEPKNIAKAGKQEEEKYTQEMPAMKKLLFAATVFLSFIAMLFSVSAQAQTDTQSFSLKTGWNAIFLEVEPAINTPATVFSTIMSQLTSVWKWNPGTSTIQFIQNPNEFPTNQTEPNWLVYFNPVIPGVNNLNAILGESVYLINVKADCPLVITGKPKIPRIAWKADSFNLVGFHLVNPTSPPTTPKYYDFFSASSSHTGQKIYTFNNTTGKWEEVTPNQTNMVRGQAFWIFCKGYSDFQGPLSVQLEQSTGLNYGTTLIDQDLRIFNNSSSNKDVYLNVSSATVNLHYWQFNTSTNSGQWNPLPTQLTKLITIAPWQPWQTTPTQTTPANNTDIIRLGTKRFGMSGTNTACVTVTDNAGIRILIPVSVTGVSLDGLWVGTANIKTGE